MDQATTHIKRIAIIGGGPSGLFMYKHLIESCYSDTEIHIFEKKGCLGQGMPYSTEGANTEHITNVSDNEIPTIVTHIKEWIYDAPKELLEKFDIQPERFNEYKVLPRLFFGHYLSAQFELLKNRAHEHGIVTQLHLNTLIHDITDQPDRDEVWIETVNGAVEKFDHAIICTGHHWPKKNEGIIQGYYDSPYPPAKLELKLNHPVALRGSSLTAIDAIRTLARCNGSFEKTENGFLTFHLNEDSRDFKIIMHSRNGFLPAIRFHLEDSHLRNDSLLTPEQIAEHIKENNGFLSLDYVFEKDFKDIFREKDPEFYQRIKDMTIETFVEAMMELREQVEPFTLFKAEYKEAEKSIKRHESVYWKEMLAILSFAMNYPAKHLSAEDMQRLQKELLPLISLVIAFVPQSSCKELMALHDAGLLEIISVGAENEIEVKEDSRGIIYHYTNDKNEKQSTRYQTFIDCVGQPHLSYKDFPFKSLLSQKTISPARLKFRSKDAGEKAFKNGNKEVEQDSNGEFYLNVPGITINDNFQIIDPYGAYNPRLYIMAIPYIGGYNPDYSGLDFCEAASLRIANTLLNVKLQEMSR